MRPKTPNEDDQRKAWREDAEAMIDAMIAGGRMGSGVNVGPGETVTATVKIPIPATKRANEQMDEE